MNAAEVSVKADERESQQEHHFLHTSGCAGLRGADAVDLAEHSLSRTPALPLALSRLKLWTYRLARGGSYDKALRFDHILGFMPFYGDSLEGSILFNRENTGGAHLPETVSLR